MNIINTANSSNDFQNYAISSHSSNYNLILNQATSNNFRQYSLAVFTSNYIQSVNKNFNNYLPLTGGTLSGTLTGTTINATTLQQGSTSLNTILTNNLVNYLLLTGGTLSGTLSGTTINATNNLQEGGVNLSTKYGIFTSNYASVLNQQTLNYINTANS